MLTKKLENAVKKVTDIIKEDESPSDAAEWCIGEIVVQVADNHYEALGIFEEAMQRYRQISLEVLEEESKEAEEGVVGG